MLRCACPGCRSLSELDESLRGHKVRCRACDQVYAVDAAVVADAEPVPVVLEFAEPPLVELVKERPARRSPHRDEPAPTRTSTSVPILIVVGVVGFLVLLAASGVGLFVWSQSTGGTLTAYPGPPQMTVVVDPDGEFADGALIERPLAGLPEMSGDLRITPLDLKPGRLVGDLHWDATGEHFYALETTGLLRRIRFDDLRETTRRRLGQACSAMAVSQRGPVVLQVESGQLRVLDGERLTQRSWVPGHDAGEITASPAGDAVVTRSVAGGTLTICRLARPSMLPGKAGPVDPAVAPVMSPDGRELFTVSRAGAGWALSRHRLPAEEGSPPDWAHPAAVSGPLGPGRPRRICLSPDGEYVCVTLSDDGAPGDGLAPPGIPVFRCVNLTRPAFSVPLGPGPQAVAFDPAAGEIYAQDRDHSLIRFDMTGTRLRAYDLPADPTEDGEVRQLLVHPSGRKLLRVSAAGRIDRIDIGPE
jgi:DNA-binding beta-propeller fold protein YncE